MTLKVFFDGEEISQYLVVTGLDRGIFHGKNSRTENRNNRKGVLFLGTSSFLPTIDMDFTLIDGVMEKRRALAKILNVSEPKKLTFSDEPDKYYLAYPTGDTNFSDSKRYGSGTIKWEIPDAVAFSEEEFEFKNNGTNAIVIDNPGTEPMQLEMTAEFTSDCGALGLENDDGSVKVMFGNFAEADGEDYLKSEKLIDTTDFSDWTDGTVNHENTGKKCGMALSTYQNEYLGALSGSVNSTGGIADGGLKYINVPADSNGHVGASKFYLWAESWFEIGMTTQTGITGLNVVTADDKLIASYIIEKADSNGRRARVIFKVGGDNPKQVKVINFDAASVKPPNPWIAPGGPWDMKKVGSQISFYWYGSAYTFNVSSLDNMEAAKIEYYVGQWNGRENNTNSFVTRTYIRNLKFTKLNVDAWRNNPNKFGAGDVLVYGQNGRNIFATINGLQGLSLRDPASTIVTAPPGKSTIYLMWSDFATAPNVTLKGRAMYT